MGEKKNCWNLCQRWSHSRSRADGSPKYPNIWNIFRRAVFHYWPICVAHCFPFILDCIFDKNILLAVDIFQIFPGENLMKILLPMPLHQVVHFMLHLWSSEVAKVGLLCNHCFHLHYVVYTQPHKNQLYGNSKEMKALTKKLLYWPFLATSAIITINSFVTTTTYRNCGNSYGEDHRLHKIF